MVRVVSLYTLKRLLELRLLLMHIRVRVAETRKLTGGKDALGEVRVSVEFEGGDYAGRGLSQDVVEAVARAYVRAVDAMMAHRGPILQEMR